MSRVFKISKLFSATLMLACLWRRVLASAQPFRNSSPQVVGPPSSLPVPCSLEKPVVWPGDTISVRFWDTAPAQSVQPTWTATGGQITVKGTRVRWDFSGVEPGQAPAVTHTLPSNLHEAHEKGPKAAAKAAPPAEAKAIVPAKAAVPAALASISWRYVVGTFQVQIPVTTGDKILLSEANTLAIMRWRLQQMAPTNRWHRCWCAISAILPHESMVSVATRIAFSRRQTGFLLNRSLDLPSVCTPAKCAKCCSTASEASRVLFSMTVKVRTPSNHGTLTSEKSPFELAKNGCCCLFTSSPSAETESASLWYVADGAFCGVP